ncbi:hypothetical protein L5G32_02905 [Gordonia sp. HY002]|uniref:hypothetical protein n=1 Tax=Gordonia zhenghanii TaxID=2911516 RepID=UPI001EF0BB0A|nr:hypothetical protein [Gordonia zhenghanii]MCF8569216.1 hypothetical protein [Gordonia zhenghanii]MCF8603552.1 hypothetical protein [Gordonia zhenghanii]
MIVAPAQRSSAVIPADAVVMGVGAFAALGSYLMPWYGSVARPAQHVTGLGFADDPAIELHSVRLNWMIAAAAIIALVLAARRLTGRADRSWRRVTDLVVTLAVVGSVFDLLTVPDQMAPAHGLVFAVAGAATTATGALLCRRRIGQVTT